MCTFPIFFWVRKNTQGDLNKFVAGMAAPRSALKFTFFQSRWGEVQVSLDNKLIFPNLEYLGWLRG